MTELKYEILGRLYQLRPHEYLDRSAVLAEFSTPENIFDVEQVLEDLLEDRLVTFLADKQNAYRLRSSGRTLYESETQRRNDAALEEHRRSEALQQHQQERAEDKAEQKRDRRNELFASVIGSFLGAFFGILLGLLAERLF